MTLDLPTDPRVNVSSVLEQFDSNHVTVIIEWTLDNSFPVSYNVSVVPQREIMFSGSRTARLTVPYNSLHKAPIC